MKTASLPPHGSVTEYGAAVKAAIDRARSRCSRRRGRPIRYHESGGLDLRTSSPARMRIIYHPAHVTRRSHGELLEIEGMLQDDRLNDNDRHALNGAQQALRNVLASETWQQASQTFYWIDNRPSQAVSLLLH